MNKNNRNINRAGLGRFSRAEYLQKRYDSLVTRFGILEAKLDKATDALLESDQRAKDLQFRSEYINNKQKARELNESDTAFINSIEKDHAKAVNAYVDSLLESDERFKRLRSQFEALQKEIQDLKEDSKDSDMDFDFSEFDINDKNEEKEEDKDEKEDEEVEDKKEEDSKEEEDSKDDDDEEKDHDEEEISLASIIIEVTDVDAVIEELKEYKIPEDAIKIVEQEDGEDEGKIKVDADYITELGEYCSSKGWDLEEALGGKIVKGDDEDKDSEDSDKEDEKLNKLASMDPDDISDEDLFGPEEPEEEKDSDK